MTTELIEQKEVKRLINIGELVYGVIVMNPTKKLNSEDYALRISYGENGKLERYLKRQDISRVRAFRSLDAAWSTAQRLGLTSALVDPLMNQTVKLVNQTANITNQVA
ncbi:MAG: hypothetical protein V7749_00635 [Cocleimonas sp.]